MSVTGFDDANRGQAALAAVCVALVLVTVVLGAAVTVAGDAVHDSRREPLERRAAATLAARLVAADATVTYDRNVLNRTAVGNLSDAAVNRLAPPVTGRDVRIRLSGRPVFERGTPGGGTTVRRLVRVGNRTRTRQTVALNRTDTVRFEERTTRLDVRVRPRNNTTVRTVRLNDRVVLHNESGIVGRTALRTARRAEPSLTFAVYGNVTPGNASSGVRLGPANRSLASGTVTVAAYPLNTTAATLEVTVDG